MDTFAEYILNEKDVASKIEIVYYLSKKQKIFFDKSIIFKTELARLFLKYSDLDLDENLVLTACLLCNCKKIKDTTDLEEIKQYAKKGAEYLKTIGFDDKFCKVCEEMNRYSKSYPREKESDVVELVEQFGGMILGRPERSGLKTDDAMVLLTYKNLKDKYNRYSENFTQFVEMLEKIDNDEKDNVKVIPNLKTIYDETDKLSDFMIKVVNYYEPKVDNYIDSRYEKIQNEFNIQTQDSNRALFSKEITRKVLENANKKII